MGTPDGPPPPVDRVMALVEATIETGQPNAIRNQLVAQARKLLREQIDKRVVQEALREWDSRPGISPALLPHLVSDILRRARPQDKPEPDWEAQLHEEMGG